MLYRSCWNMSCSGKLFKIPALPLTTSKSNMNHSYPWPFPLRFCCKFVVIQEAMAFDIGYIPLAYQYWWKRRLQSLPLRMHGLFLNTKLISSQHFSGGRTAPVLLWVLRVRVVWLWESSASSSSSCCWFHQCFYSYHEHRSGSLENKYIWTYSTISLLLYRYCMLLQEELYCGRYHQGITNCTHGTAHYSR